ncbi:hypothetical protein ACOI9R_36460, partial [Mesorhizobium japonicum]
FDVLAANPLATALSPRIRPGENRLRSLLLDPEEQAFHRDWPTVSAAFVASFRGTVGDDAPTRSLPRRDLSHPVNSCQTGRFGSRLTP